MYRVRCHYGLGRKLDRQRFARVRIGFEKRSTRTGDRDSDTMPGVKNLTNPTYVKGHFGNLLALKRFLCRSHCGSEPDEHSQPTRSSDRLDTHH